MADFVLTLGSVGFKKFEIPDELSGGGEQSIAVHKYGGGTRTIDAFGADDAPLKWSGIFFDEDAEPRCQQIDAMRFAGEPVPAEFSSFAYLVVIKSFTWRFKKFYQIDYSIELEVVNDLSQPQTDSTEDTETSVQDDFSDANDYGSNIGI